MNDMKELIEQLKDMNYQFSKIRSHLQGIEEHLDNISLNNN